MCKIGAKSLMAVTGGLLSQCLIPEPHGKSGLYFLAIDCLADVFIDSVAFVCDLGFEN